MWSALFSLFLSVLKGLGAFLTGKSIGSHQEREKQREAFLRQLKQANDARIEVRSLSDDNKRSKLFKNWTRK